MERLTRKKDNYPCRLAGGCMAEEWMVSCYHGEVGYPEGVVCDTCPFMKYINTLAEYEDKEENK